jgi:uncharacterized membrane protein YjgN (DUF898 family)
MKQIFIVLSLLAFFIALPMPATAQDARTRACEGANFGSSSTCSGNELESISKKVANAIIFVIGAISVVVMIVAGFMLVTSAGDPQKSKRARDALLFAIVGIIVAIMAYAIADFVIDQLTGPPPEEAGAPAD